MSWNKSLSKKFQTIILDRGGRMNKKVFIIRHCQAEGQEAQAALTKLGRKQAVELSEFLSNTAISRIISSPFLRAHQSIEPFATTKQLTIEIDHRLSERILSTSSMDNWLVKLEETFEDMELKLEGGESSKEAQQRIVEVLDEILTNDHESTAIVTHGNIMSLLLNNYDKKFDFEQWKNLSNPDVFLLHFSDGNCSIERIWQD